MNVEIRVRYVVVFFGFEATTHLVDLRAASALAVDTLNVHASQLDF